MAGVRDLHSKKRNGSSRRRSANATSWNERLTSYDEEQVVKMTLSKHDKLEWGTYQLRRGTGRGDNCQQKRWVGTRDIRPTKRDRSWRRSTNAMSLNHKLMTYETSLSVFSAVIALLKCKNKINSLWSKHHVEIMHFNMLKSTYHKVREPWQDPACKWIDFFFQKLILTILQGNRWHNNTCSVKISLVMMVEDGKNILPDCIADTQFEIISLSRHKQLLQNFIVECGCHFFHKFTAISQRSMHI